MDATKRAASVLRAAGKRHLQQGADLILQADELDPPAPAVDHAVRSLCGSCGTEYRGREYGTGQRCESCDERGQTGYLRRGQPTVPRCDCHAAQMPCTCGVTCDVCGLQVAKGGANDGDPCWAMHCKDGFGGYLKTKCTGTFRLPDEPLVTTDGRSLGVTRDELASQAAMEAAAEDWMGADSWPGIDIATTFRGGKSG